MKTALFIGLMVILLSICLFGCAENVTEDDAAEIPPQHIVYIQGMDDAFHDAIAQGMQDACDEAGFTFEILGTVADNKQQIQTVESLIGQNKRDQCGYDIACSP